MSYLLQIPKKIIGGIGSLDNIKDLLKDINTKKATIITDNGVKNANLIEKPLDLLKSIGISIEIVENVPSEPEIGQVEDIFSSIKNKTPDILIGIGGGSVMDVTKLISVMMTNKESLEEIISTGIIKNKGITTMMIPTTAGTGSEVTKNSIVTNPEQQVKITLSHELLIPDYVIADPLMTVKLPPAITASTGMDALTHAIECYISKKANPFSDTFALRAVRLIARSIKKAYDNGKDIAARLDMSIGALYGGVCINSSGTAAVHALAYPLGGKYKVPHGVANAMLLPYVIEFNSDVIEDKLADIYNEMGLPNQEKLNNREKSCDVIKNIYLLVKELNIPNSIRNYGITENDVEEMARAASQITRLMSNNPKKMSVNDIIDIYRKLL